jgi:hypothetical protein
LVINRSSSAIRCESSSYKITPENAVPLFAGACYGLQIAGARSGGGTPVQLASARLATVVFAANLAGCAPVCTVLNRAPEPSRPATAAPAERMLDASTP